MTPVNSGDSLEEERRRRRRKDGKTKKLIQVALAVTEKYGFSLFHRTYPGNVSNGRIFQDFVERAFKQLKGVLDLRPVRVWLRSHIEAHIKICYHAYAILSLLDYHVRKLGITGTEALDLLRTGYRVYLEDEWVRVPMEFARNAEEDTRANRGCSGQKQLKT